MYLSVSLPRVEGADLRPWVPPEHSLVISSAQYATRGEEEKQTAGDNTALDWEPASFLTLEWEAAAQMSKQKLRVRHYPSVKLAFLTINPGAFQIDGFCIQMKRLQYINILLNLQVERC